MLDIGWTELLVIGVVALIVVGPKDLPVMFRTLGKFTGRMRTMAREFSRAMDDAADSAGAKDLARDLRNMSNPRSAATQSFKKAAGLDDLQKEFDNLDSDDVEDEGARDTTTPPKPKPEPKPASEMGAHTKALAEERAREARERRADAVKRANERSATFRGFDDASDAPKTAAAQAETTPAPAPGEAAPAAEAQPEPQPERDKA